MQGPKGTAADLGDLRLIVVSTASSHYIVSLFRRLMTVRKCLIRVMISIVYGESLYLQVV